MLRMPQRFSSGQVQREWAFHMPDDQRQGDFFGRFAQAISAGDAAAAFHDASGFQIVEDLFEEAFGNVLLVGNRLNPHDRFAIVQSKYNECPQGILTP